MSLYIVTTSIFAVTVVIEIFLSHDHPGTVMFGYAMLVGEVVKLSW